MPPVSKKKLKARKAGQASANARKAGHEKGIQDINNMLIQMDDNELQLVYQSIIQQTYDKKLNRTTLRQKLIDRVKQLPDDQLKSALHLFNTMRYSKGPNEGNLLSPFLQNKALSFISSSLYKAGQDSDSLVQKIRHLKNRSMCTPNADFVTCTITRLRNIAEDHYLFFREELLESLDLLNDDQLFKLTSDLECGVQKALELYQKWLDCRLHLPLSICRLGGKYGWEFARSFAHVILGIPWFSVPSL
ncbi:hypothetical protein C2G38_2034187 [Gigaspora rosea]|uniref:Uncharacterized protein n=1 Tax=Gigaspora rosea TaxID=44941 RepID=A0A397VRE3_9GLOM|nr:hypothetical protein C2G38_2034187 [Gigaspora rosea]